jgi:hypothetical protein
MQRQEIPPVALWQKKEKRMRKCTVLTLFVFSIFLAGIQFASADCLKLVKIEEPSKGKNKLNLNVDHLNAVVESFGSNETAADIQLVDAAGNLLAALGKVENGKIDWSSKIVDGTFLQVKFDKSQYEEILEKVKEKSPKPGFRVQLSTGEGCAITFAELPDLAVKLKYPINASPGEALTGDIVLTVENNGTAAAENFDVELVMSGTMEIPVQPAASSENFKDGMLLEGGRETVSSIKPGERLTLNFKGPLTVPADTVPGRYYLGAVVDPGRKVAELNEENNKETGFIMIAVPEPRQLVLEIPDTQVVYQPAGFSLKILSRGVLLSDGSEWRKCSIRPYLHQIKQATWEDFFWEVDTIDRSVWQVTGIDFCHKGGKAHEVKMKVEVSGGSKTAPPMRFVLNLADTRLEYEPAAGKFRIQAFGNQFAYTPFWKIIRPKPHLFQLKHQTWEDFYWEVDTFKKEVHQVTGGSFGQTDSGGEIKVLDIKLSLEY